MQFHLTALLRVWISCVESLNKLTSNTQERYKQMTCIHIEDCDRMNYIGFNYGHILDFLAFAQKQMPLYVLSMQNITHPRQFSTHPAQNALTLVSG